MIQNSTQFSGFPKETLTFLNQLDANNNREWFEENRYIYEQYFEVPANSFANYIQQRISSLIRVQTHSKVFRIYRDLRFTKNKSPFKTSIHIFFSQLNGARSQTQLGFHFRLKTGQLSLAVGSFVLQPLIIEAYRDAIVNNETGEAICNILARYTKNDGFHIDEPSLKRVPGGYNKNHIRGDLLRRKSLLLWHHSPLNQIIHTTQFADWVTEKYQTMLPVYQWLNAL